jgi:hypothetical protein
MTGRLIMNSARPIGQMLLATLLLALLAACGANASPSTVPDIGASGAAAQAAQPTISTGPLTSAAQPTTPTPVAQATIASNPPALAAQPTTAAPAASSGSPRDAIIAAGKAARAATSYRAQATITQAGADMGEITTDTVAPDRAHMMMKIAGQNTETIRIGETTYSRVNDGQWVKAPPSHATPQLIDALIKAESITDAQLVGPDTLDEKSTLVYQYSAKLTMDVKSKFEFSIVGKVWVGVADGLPYKNEADVTVNASGKPITSHVATIYSDYNNGIKIEAPIP